MKMRLATLSIAVLALGMGMSSRTMVAQIQVGRPDPDQLDKFNAGYSDPKMMATDRLFLSTAVQGGLAEIQLGTLATQKGGDQVKQLGERLMHDHTVLNDSLKSDAKGLGFGVPDKVSKKDMAEYNKLNGLSGPEFDKEFLDFVIKDHKKDLSDYQDEDGKTPNQNLKATVDKGIQIIQAHLQMAQKIAAGH